MAQHERIRQPAVAGMFYDSHPHSLEMTVKGYLAEAPLQRTKDPVIALISPHAGLQFSGKAAARGFKLLDPERVRRVFILAPSHRFPFRGVSVPSVDAYQTPLGTIPLDRDVCDGLLEKSPLFSSIPEAHTEEHSLEVQLPFLQVVLKRFTLVPMLVGGIDPSDSKTIADILGNTIDERDLLIASSDFTHQGPRFGYVPYEKNIKERIRDLDMGAVDRILEKSSEKFIRYVADTGATICGHHPIAVLLHMLPDKAEGNLLSYYTSGDILGDETESVSYAAIAFENASGWALS